MKPILLVLITLTSQITLSQNIFPTSPSGGVGIGTTTPQHGYIHINGNGASSGINLWTNSGESTSRIWIDANSKLLHITRTSDPLKGITLSNDGRMGLGTTSFDSQFEIKHTGTIGAKWSTNLSYFKLTDGTNSLIADPNEIYTNQTLALGSSYDHPIYFRNVNSSGKTDLMTIKQDGKVGIGTTDPAHGKLQIYGSGASEGITLWTNSGEVTSRIWINPTSKLFHFSRGTDPLKGFTLDNDGNMSIGSLEHGTHKLAVEGTIGAREIKVEASGWSDFVFKNNYELRTLEEVERHIAERGHLPEIPSEEEVTENGINLGEMDAKLLMKIEELTLYMIEMNKQVQQLKSENQELKEKVNSLENE